MLGAKGGVTAMCIIRTLEMRRKLGSAQLDNR